MSADKCQWCGETYNTILRKYECGTAKTIDGLTHYQSQLCRERVKVAKLHRRVEELEGLAIGNECTQDGGRWFEVFIPTERLGGSNCEGEESPTLGDAMPRKEEL